MKINQRSLIGLICALFMLFTMGPIANGQEIYGIQNNGALLWYRHLGQGDGTVSWQGPKQVGTGWQGFKSVFAGPGGVIYGIQNNGALLWYRHLGQGDGTVSWQGPKQVGTGWQGFMSVFTVSP